MNTLTLVAVIGLSLLVLAGIVMAITTDSPTTSPKTLAKQDSTCCSGNSCTAENNCGKATCGAVNGGSCSCGK
jgi:hypothetical protein